MEIFRLHRLVMAPLGDDYILSSSVGALSGIQGNPVLLNDPHYTILLWKTWIITSNFHGFSTTFKPLLLLKTVLIEFPW